VSRRVNLEKWLHVDAGCYKTKDGRASIFKVGPNDWATQVGPPGQGRSVGNGHTAAIAALFVENVLDGRRLSEVQSTKRRCKGKKS
jgi:hypothetical protein